MGGDFGGVWYWNRFPGSSATTTPTAISRCSKNWTSFRRRSSPTVPRSTSTASASQSISVSTTARSSPPRFATLRWDETIKRWRLSTNRGDDIRARFVVMAQGSFNRPKLPGIPGIKDFKGHSSIRRAGITTTPAGTPTADCTSCTTSASRSSAPVRPACNWFRTWAETPSTSMSFSARPHRWTLRGNEPTDPQWAASLQPGWQEERKRNFHRWSPLGEGAVFDRAGSGLRFLDRARAQPDRTDRALSEDPASLTIEANHGDPRRRGLQGHGAAAAPRRGGRRRPGDRRGAQAVLPVHVQAALQQRRILADIQSPERHAGRRVGDARACERAHREGPRRQRR